MSSKTKLLFARAAWVVALGIAVTAMSALYLMATNNPNGIVMLDQFGPGYRAYAVFVLTAVLSGFGSIFLRHRVQVFRQARNEGSAEQLLNHLLSSPEGAHPEYFIYLRSFETTGKLKPPFFFTLAALQRLHTNELESFLALALEKEGLLLGLGRPGENIGAARIRVANADWQADVLQLITYATGILLIPSSHQGTQWEIQQLQSCGLLPSTVFIMPPKTNQFDWRVKWQEACEALSKLSITLPEYSERGLLFTVGQTGELKSARPFPLFFRRSLKKLIRQLLSDESPSGQQALLKANRQSALLWFYGKFSAVISYFVMTPVMILLALASVINGTALKGISPTPPWSSFLARYDSASEIGSGQSLVDAKILLTEHRKVPESSIDARALQRLTAVSDVDRQTFLLGFGKMLSFSPDESVCEAAASGQASDLDRIRMLVQMPDQQVQLWMQARQSVLFARTRTVQNEKIAPSTELQMALKPVIGERHAKEIIRVLTSGQPMTKQELCETGISGYVALTRLAEPLNSELAHWLATRYWR